MKDKKTLTHSVDQFLTIEEAAKVLGKSAAYVLRLCLQSSIQLSIRFANLTAAKQRRHIPVEVGFVCRQKIAIGLYDRTFTLGSSTDIWDFLMIGTGKICIEREYQKAIGGAEITQTSSIGIYVSAPDGNALRVYEIQECRGDPSRALLGDDDFHNASALPPGSELVIRIHSLDAYLSKTPDKMGISKRNAAIRATYLELVEAGKTNYVKEIMRIVPGAKELHERQIRRIAKEQ